MSAFSLSSPASAAALGAVLLAVLLAALLVSRLRGPRAARGAGWSLAVLAPCVAHVVAHSEPSGVRMIAVCAALLLAMKALVSVEAAIAGGPRLGVGRWLAFAMLWPGMRPAAFARLEPRGGAGRLVLRGLAHAAAGAVLIALARRAWSATDSGAAASVLLLPGLSLMLHFGLLDVLTGLWRAVGADVSPPFRAPWRSDSLREFWARRWNVAFSEMTAAVVYRPLRARVRPWVALMAGFLFSGLLHEAAISVPVGAGFGGPLLYFALHGTLATLETARGPLGRPATLAAILLPLPLLFHAPFLRGVLWPLLSAR